ncbi:MAG: putative metallopeptidase [Thermoguttaceae bacterium]|jgi:predicted metallopeptidase|nr:putative metallopeptidase [Thermoguttaceae bacterium]
MMPSSGSSASRGPGRRGPGFDFTFHARRLCEDMTARLPELAHIDMARVAVGFSQARKNVGHGLFASLTPLRFAGGRTETVRRGRRWTIQRLVDASGREMLYVLTFYLPRFLDLEFHEKLSTIVHELWHIGPRFDGDLRRFAGRCYVHSGSQKRYHAHAAQLARQWLAMNPPESLYAFLRHDFRGLAALYGRVFGRRAPTPKLIPL